MGDFDNISFNRRPYRIAVPPANESVERDLHDVLVKIETDPERIAFFCREASWGDLFREPTPDEIAETLDEIAAGKALGAALEVPAIAFRIRASRVSMDQLLRHRQTAAGAQSTRDNDMRAFNVYVPPLVAESPLLDEVREHTEKARELYGRLVDSGVHPGDARYVALPIGFETHWIQIMNLRTLQMICERRTCNGLIQHETNIIVRKMREQAVALWPWLSASTRSFCEKAGRCTTGGSLFPPCGAFGGVSSEFDPERHLYPAESNSGMEFVEEDRLRAEEA